MQLPDEFFRKEMSKKGITLPKLGEYGVATIFLPRKSDEQLICEGLIEKIVAEEGQKLIGWRDVPVVESSIGATAASTMPVIKQIFIEKEASCENFEYRCQ